MRIKWAEWRGPIYGRRENGFAHPALGMVCHIMGSTASAADNWFHSPKAGDPNGGAGATFGICNGQSKWPDGHLIQWADTDDRCWAQGNGNSYYHSVETEGAGGPMTQAQVETFARLYKELAAVEGFPFVLAEHPGEMGLGWHGMGAAAWGGHNYCPGPERRAQRSQILQLAKGQAPAPIQEDEMLFIVSNDTNNYITNSQTKHTLASQAEIDMWVSLGAKDARGTVPHNVVNKIPLSD